MPKNNWYRVDNVAKVFLASYNRRDTRSFRVSCTLQESIDKELLTLALKTTVRERPQYQVLIHRGLFWHYMETTDKTAFVEEEKTRPCPTLYGPEVAGQLHYRVSYFGSRINLDMFHALSDGNGGIEFLNILVLNYLKLCYPDTLDEVSIDSGASDNDLNQDSYRQFYTKKGQAEASPKKSYHIRGLKLPHHQLQFFELQLSAGEMLKLAKATGVSLTSYLGAILMRAIYYDMPSLQKNRPITISMPVNLRNYYPSATSRNFFNSVYVSHVFTGEEDLQSLARQFDAELKKALTPEQIAARMDNYEKLEQLFLVRMVPLFIKNPVVKLATRRETKRVTAVISNLGRLRVPNALAPHISSYAAYCSTGSLFITCNTYDDVLTLGICSAYQNTSVLKTFVRTLTEQGLDASLYATEVLD
ncbi:MAG: hypothetical protein NC417_11835 [Candidatus Gastranaerophilales bacterium]|nr:hypothetical protein [Candidatus Gastranaerophilales bacterium]